ncbi:Uma2 family endonuclease [Alienimonas californiensis]|uniref:Putative restriction endonuclease domain-containing protein n=1 Tax=Alienimonas californiensis TaxID=2527989 RepID=A0A517P7K7_9PLAN|nr:Uma2 family endonuclease [Alienimonas californiensis]QDT15366.1 hypothetical protein CA12_14510 [Alienimonas californiensis]
MSALAPPSAEMPPGTRVVLDGVDWETYVRLADAPDTECFRFTFDEPTGRLEMERQGGFLHEVTSAAIALLTTAFARERGIRTHGVGSLSLRRPGSGGADPDESFYISSFDRLPARDTNVPDLERELPPDLVIEVDVTSPGVSKLPIYARLGVKEVWVWAEDALVCHRLNDAGEYDATTDSGELPGFPLAFAAELIRQRPDAADAELQDALIARLRENRGGPPG